MNLEALRKYPFDYDVPSALRDDGCNAFNVTPLLDPLYKQAKRRVLIMFQHVPTEDLRAKRLMSGAHGKALNNMLKMARAHAVTAGMDVTGSIGFAVASYNYFKTYHLESSDKRELAEKAERRRARELVSQLKPHVILAIGNNVAVALTGLDGAEDRQYAPYYRGYALPGEKISAKVIPLHDFTLQAGSSDEDDDGEDDFGEKKLVAEANLLGYAARCASTVYIRQYVRAFSVPDFEVKYQVINTIKKFDRFFEALMTKKVVSCDTETDSLARITNRVLTLQFAWSPKMAYILPVMHRDSPWKASQLEYIKGKLKEFFAKPFDPLDKVYDTYLIGQNYKFDMTPIRHWLGIYAIYWPVWDLQAGEYCFAPQTLVETENGPMRVDALTSMTSPPKVLSFNHETQQQEYKSISATSEHATEEDMYEIEYEGGTLQVTGNHKLWSITRNAYVRVDEILEGEFLLPMQLAQDGPLGFVSDSTARS
jgi:hypothetical protein